MHNIRFCPKCGDIDLIHIGKICNYCGFEYLETQYKFLESTEKGNLKPEIRQAIEQEYINKSPDFSEEAKEKRLQEEHDKRIYGHSNSYSSSIKCPYCKSTNVSKISTAGRAVSVGLFGLASGKIGKQWHCNKCKSDF